MSGIVGVHGVGNHRPNCTPEQATATLNTTWSDALSRGPGGARTPIQVAYYAQQLTRGTGQGPDNVDVLDLENRRLLQLWGGHLGASGTPASWLTWPPRQVVEWMANRGGFATAPVQAFVTRFLHELQTYFTVPAARQRARDTVATTIRTAQPSVLIAHSLGSVVAYETLWANPDLHVDLLLTIGSPLGIPDLVRERLEPAPGDGLGKRPPNVTRWINLTDPGDLCAVPRWLGRSFEIHEDIEAPIGTFAFHKVVHYLASPAMAKALSGDQ